MLNDPSRVDAMVADGFSLLVDGDVPSAMMMAENSLKLDPNHASAWHLLAVSHFEWLELDSAMKAFGRAIECDRREPIFYFGRGKTHLEQDRAKPAMDDFNRALQIKPEMTLCLFAMADCAQRLGDVESAASYLERCHELEPDEPFYVTMLCDTYLQLATNNWPEDSNGDALPTTYQHIVTAKQYIRKIEQLPGTADIAELQAVLKNLRELLAAHEKRRFRATRKPGVLALVLGFFFLAAGASLLGYGLIGGGLLYFFALRSPQYDLNRRALDPGALTRFDDVMYRLYYHPSSPDTPIPVRLLGGFIRVLVVPILAVWALFENYDVADFVRLEAARLQVFVQNRLLDDPLLKLIRRRAATA